jgi:AbrB family looped-hinge helix DNA binding protein
MNAFTTTMTTKGQVTVPAEIRHKLGLRPSDKLKIREEKGRVVLEKDDYWAEYERLQKKVQAHALRKGIAPLSDDEIRSLRNQAWRGNAD